MKTRWPILLAALAILGLVSALGRGPGVDDPYSGRPAADAPPPPAPADGPVAEATGSGDRPVEVLAAPPRPAPEREASARLVLRFEREARFLGVVVVLDERLGREREDVVAGTSIVLEGLTPGRKELVLYRQFAAVREPVVVGPGLTERVIALPPLPEAAVLHGRLLDAGGFPIPEFEVSVRMPATAPFEGWTDEAPVALFETFVGSEGVVGLSGSTRRFRLDADGWVTTAAESDLHGRFLLTVPASADAPVEVRIAGRGLELLRPMRHLEPEFGSIEDEPTVEDLRLDEIPTAFPGLAPADRGRYVFALLARLHGATSIAGSRDARDALLAWFEGQDLPGFAERIDALARRTCLAIETAREPDPSEVVLDVTEREEAIRDLVILVRAVLDDLAAEETDREAARRELVRTLELLERDDD